VRAAGGESVRLAAKVDGNQKSIVKGLRARGVRVLVLSRVGKGCPDLLAGTPRANTLLEVKTDDGDLTPAQAAFFASWPGPKAVVRSLDEALAAVGRLV